MKLYPKKLRSISDLEKEKARLQKRVRQLDQEEFLPMGSLFAGAGKEKKEKSGGEGGSLLDYIPTSNPIASLLIDIVKARLAKPTTAKKADSPDVPKVKGTGIGLKIAKEFIGGYLKWKAIELSYKGIRYLINSRKKTE